MALYYCRTHQRLWAKPSQWWTAMPAALIAQITALYHRVPLPEFKVIAASCDQCAPEETVDECSRPGT
jgi:hypothetical protein